MENKFKKGDIVYLYKEITQEDWMKHDIGYIDITFKINEPLIITNVASHTIKLEGHYKGYYPYQCFKLYNPLKIELNKLKEIILTKTIRVTKKERRRFEQLCFKLELPMTKDGFVNLSDKAFGKESECGMHGEALIYFETDENTDLNFKDLIEPFKKFKDEIL